MLTYGLAYKNMWSLQRSITAAEAVCIIVVGGFAMGAYVHSVDDAENLFFSPPFAPGNFKT